MNNWEWQMSQHYFDTMHEGSRVLVLMGWDRPLAHYFMIIERNPPGYIEDDDEDGASDDGCILYSNLDDHNAFRQGLADFKIKLAEFGIQVPGSMFEQVERDQALNIGNRQVWYGTDGSFSEDRKACA